MDWYKRYIGDYARDTGRLSPLQHGIYSLLLDHYYAEEAPLPSDFRELYRIAKCATKSEQKSCRKVAERFFTVGSDGALHNSRADKEIASVKQLIQQAKESGMRGANKRWGSRGPTGDPNRDPNGKPTKKSMAATMALQIPDSRSKNSVPPERVNPDSVLAAQMTVGKNGSHRVLQEDPEEERVKRALVLLNADPSTTEHDAARMFHVSVDAIREARRT